LNIDRQVNSLPRLARDSTFGRPRLTSRRRPLVRRTGRQNQADPAPL